MSQTYDDARAAMRETGAMLDQLDATLNAMTRLMRSRPAPPAPRPAPREVGDFWLTCAVLWLPLVSIMAGTFLLGFRLGGL